MIVEVRIAIELPDVEHSDEDISNYVNHKFGVDLMKRDNPFIKAHYKQVGLNWEYDDVDANLIESE